MNDSEFLYHFEKHTLDQKYFDHQGHLRLAWLYLSEHDLDTSIQLVCNGIKSYAESLGATTKFHLTITDATVRIIQQRMLAKKTHSWESFLEKNPDLVNHLLSILQRHFSPELLATETARTTLVKADLLSL